MNFAKKVSENHILSKCWVYCLIFLAIYVVYSVYDIRDAIRVGILDQIGVDVEIHVSCKLKCRQCFMSCIDDILCDE